MSKVYVEGEFISERIAVCEVHFSNEHNGNKGIRVLVDKQMVHKAIPAQEPEWRPEKVYDFFEAMYLGRKYDLEIKHINHVWIKAREHNSEWIDQPRLYSQEWQLRKRVSAEDNARNIIEGFINPAVAETIVNALKAKGLLKLEEGA